MSIQGWQLLDGKGVLVLADTLNEQAIRETQAAVHARTKDWKEWCRVAVASGAGMAHRWTQGPGGWCQDIMAEGRPAGAQERVDQTLREWQDGPWKCDDLYKGMDIDGTEPLPPITAAEILRGIDALQARHGALH